ncbi:lactate utilization protein C [Sphingomonas sp. MMS12-HWE2-04]|uniref:LutC/YkgG family protein n=1 Tax=Sphingomonas sp. MMS12-HWE2-04 TaxID=3234199 RepID=UPI00384B5E3A
MSARAAILGRLGSSTSPDLAAGAAALLVGPERPRVDPDQLVDTFAARLAAPSLAATFETIATPLALPAAIARYLAEQGAPPSLYVPPVRWLETLDWGGLTRDRSIAVDGGAALAVATAAVAETGSLVLDTAPEAPMLPNFLALRHIILVRRETLVAQLEDIPAPAAWPRARYWITGVSGTTDIEGQYVRGAHGPRYLHILLIG